MAVAYVESQRRCRWCLICNRELVTCKRYSSLSTIARKKPSFISLLCEIVEDTIAPSSTVYLCDGCNVKVENVHKSIELRIVIREKYHQTKLVHSRASSCSSDTAENVPAAPADFIAPHAQVGDEPSPRRRQRTTSQAAAAAATFRSPSPRHGDRVKRKAVASPGTPSLRKPLKKRLSFDQPSTGWKAEVRVYYENGSEARELLGVWSDVASAICAGDSNKAVRLVLQSQEAQEELKSTLINTVNKEVSELCDPKSHSLFRGNTLDDLQKFSYEEQDQELGATCPILSVILHAAAESPILHRNVIKTQQKIIAGITTAAGVLFNCRSQNMNAHQVLTGLILKQSGAKTSAFSHLNSRFLSSSYKSTLQRQVDFGLDFDHKVYEWAEEKFSADTKERQIKDSSSDEEWRKNQEQRVDHGYQIVMDNVDLVLHPRHTSREKHGTDLHMVHMLAIKNRVEGYHLPNDTPISTASSVDVADFLPTLSDNQHLKQEWMLIIGNIIAKYIPELKWFSDHIPPQPHHDHTKELQQKSEIVNLGVLMQSENTSEGIYQIMHHLHKYVPGHESDVPTAVISAGDLLTCERETSCKREQSNSATASQRLQGLVPEIADFHALANFYQVIWLHLYNTTSSGDKGTLYAARNFLEARNVTSDPMRNINAAADLISQYTTALVVAASMKYFGLDAISDKPTCNDFDFDKHQDRTQYVYQVLEQIVEVYAIPSNDELKKDSPSLHCPSCNKKYKTQRGLRSHMINKHPGTPQQQKPVPGQSAERDAIFNYSRVAISLCLLAVNFNEARKIGDGQRIIRLYKFLLLHFKNANKPKYGYQALRLLAHVKCFLTPRLAYELTWNRFVNKSGKANQNIEVDRENEHQNRIFKENCSGLRGKATSKSIDRISRCAQTCNEVLDAINKQTSVKKPSGKHVRPKTKDELDLAVDLHHENIFDFQPGRRHFHFVDFPNSVLSTLNVADLHKWIKSSLKQMARDNYGIA